MSYQNQQYQQQGQPNQGYQQQGYQQQGYQQQGYQNQGQYQQNQYQQQPYGQPQQQYQQNPYQQQQQQQQYVYGQGNDIDMQQAYRKDKPKKAAYNSDNENQNYNDDDNNDNNDNNNNNNNNNNNSSGKKTGWYAKLVGEPTGNFTDESFRRGFIKKVLCIIGCQMILTTLFCIGGVTNDGYKKFLKNNYFIYIFCWVISIGCMLTLYCKREQARKVPNNYILLGVFTLAESYMLSYHCAFTAPGVVLMATGILCLLVFTLTIYAVKTKRDITQKANFFFYGCFAILALVIVGAFYQNYIFHTIISLVIIFFFSAYLVFDIQRLQGNRQMAYDVDDYIIAALDIYLDIVIIFRQLLYLLGR